MSKFEELLMAAGPVALTIKEYLEPVQGAGAVFFPPTFAPPKGSEKKPAYVIDTIDGASEEGKPFRSARVGLVDSVGSQANRMEPIFAKPPYRDLIPQVAVKVGERTVDLLEAGHRAADAVIRFSTHEAQFRTAFEAIRDKGEAWELAKVAPTTIVFGGWDSRGTKVKLPRILGSVIRAWDVQELKRAAQFFSAFEKEETESFQLDPDALSSEGLLDSPSGEAPGGVIARGGVVREATLNLIVLRSLKGADEEQTAKLQQYVLGLALVAMSAPTDLFLREGCLLVRSEKGMKSEEVYRDGKRKAIEVGEDAALAFAREAAGRFGVGDGVAAVFETGRVKTAADARAAKKPKARK